jgi:hypothetical protein
VDALTAFAHSPNQKTFLMPVEAAGIIGALGGITEIARATFSGDGAAAPAQRRQVGRPPGIGQAVTGASPGESPGALAPPRSGEG